MKRLALLACAVTMAACGSDNTPTPTPTNANTLVFTAQLSGAKERPNPAVAPEANGTGTATITMTVTRDGSGNITGGTTSWTFSMSNLPSGTVIRANHIHEGDENTAGTVRIDSGLTPATAITLSNGTLTNQTFSNLTQQDTGDTGLYARIAANPNGFYFNVHSNVNTGGVMRGQLVRTQ